MSGTEKEEIYAKFDEVSKKRPYHLIRALELYKVIVRKDLMEMGKHCKHTLNQMMEECYLDFLTKSLQPDEDGETHPFNKRVEVDLKHHNQMIEKIMSGTTLPELEKDPLTELETDYNVDLTKFKDYRLQSQGTFINPAKEKVQISDGAMKQIENFQKKFKARRERRKSSMEAQERKASMEMRKLSFEEGKENIGVSVDPPLAPVKEESE
jgi:hypothetical protein